MMLSLSGTAQQVTAPTELRYFIIPSESLDRALSDLARQSGLQVLIPSELAEGKQSRALEGMFTASDALSRLLADTGLRFSFINPLTIAIDPEIEAGSSASGARAGAVTAGARSPTASKEPRTSRPGLLARLFNRPTDCVGAENCSAPVVGSVKPVRLEEIVVTGSRVIASAGDSPTPLTSVDAERLMQMHPGNVFDALNDLPVFTQTHRSQNSNPGNGGGGSNNAATNNSINGINMRGLGLSRTLVLYDGKRLPPTSPEGWVDVNMIPQMLLKRVEWVTGGASAVYGSDAVAGVVNFIPDNTFDGFKAELRGGTSSKRDGDTSAAGLAFGVHLFDDRVHAMASFNTTQDDGIDSRLSRQWGRAVWTVQGNGVTVPYHLVAGARQSNSSFGGKINSVAGSSLLTDSMQFVSVGGYPVGFNHGLGGAAYGITNTSVEVGGDGAYQNSGLEAASNLKQFFGRLDFSFRDSLQGYLNAMAAHNQVRAYTGWQTLNPATVFSGDNAYLARDYRFNGAFTMGKTLTALPRASTDSYLQETYLSAGLKGVFQERYRWDVSYGYGFTRQHNRWNAVFNNQHLYAALDAVTDSSGRVVCYAATQAATAAAYADCVPINVFGVNAESPAAINYVMDKVNDRLVTRSDDVTGSIAGAPFSNWAGPIDMAWSAEWRRLSYQAMSDYHPTDLADCTGIRYNCGSATGAKGVGNAAIADRPEVEQTVAEAAVETNIPLVSNVAFAESLNLNLAGRYANYRSRDGSFVRGFNALTWKGGLAWQVADSLTVRATQSHDFRAPNLDELFRPSQINVTSNAGTSNYFNYAPTITLSLGGNPDLQPEKSDTTTLGFVYRPLPNLSFTIDGFNVKVDHAIAYVRGIDAAVQAVCYGDRLSAACGLLGFNGAHQIDRLHSTYLNFADLKTYGLDFAADWQGALWGHHAGLHGWVAWQPHFIYRQPGFPDYEEAGTAIGSSGQSVVGAQTRLTLTGDWNFRDDWTLTVTERWRSGDIGLAENRSLFSNDRVPSVAYTAINLAYAPKLPWGRMEWFFNVQNLFNRQPPASAFYLGQNTPGAENGFLPGDDPIGRFYMLGIRVRM